MTPGARTAMMWFKQHWPARFCDELGRVLWHPRTEHGSVVENDPSQFHFYGVALKEDRIGGITGGEGAE